MTTHDTPQRQTRRAPTSGNVPRAFADEYVTIVRGDGPWVWDADGNRYLDAVSGNQNVNIGHGREEVAAAAKEQLERLEYASSMLFANEPAMEYTEKIAEFTPDGFEKTWLVSSGSEANESAIKMARQYHYERGTRASTRLFRAVAATTATPPARWQYRDFRPGRRRWSRCSRTSRKRRARDAVPL